MRTHFVVAGNRCLFASIAVTAATPSWVPNTFVKRSFDADRSVVFGWDVPTRTIPTMPSAAVRSAAIRAASAPPSECPATTHLVTPGVLPKIPSARAIGVAAEFRTTTSRVLSSR